MPVRWAAKAATIASTVVAPRTHLAERHARELHRFVRRRLGENSPQDRLSLVGAAAPPFRQRDVGRRDHEASVPRMRVNTHGALLAPLQRDERSAVERDGGASHADLFADSPHASSSS